MPEYFLIAEDHGLVTEGYKTLLDAYFPNCRYKVARGLKDLDEVLVQQGNSFSAAIWDLQLADGNAIGLIGEALQMHPGLPILVVTGLPENVYAVQLYKMGIRGFITKSAEPREVIYAIQRVVAGDIYYSRTFKSQLAAAGHDPFNISNPFSAISARELEVLKYLLAGNGIKEICAQMNLAQSTVATYKQRLLEKLHAKNVVHLQQLAAAHNII